VVVLDIFSYVVMLQDVGIVINTDELCELVRILCCYHHLF